MRIQFSFRNVESSEGLKNYASEKIAKLQKYLRAPLQAEVVFSLEKHHHQLDVSVLANGHRYAAHHVGENMYACVDLAMDKIDRQVRRDKATHLARRHG